MEKKLTKDKAKNFGWNFIDGDSAEKTAAFGANPLKTYGTDEDSLLANIADFEARLKVANGEEEEAVAEEPAEAPVAERRGERGWLRTPSPGSFRPRSSAVSALTRAE
jgi:hypothetical protein